jgi:hypothetical protein
MSAKKSLPDSHPQARIEIDPIAASQAKAWRESAARHERAGGPVAALLFRNEAFRIEQDEEALALSLTRRAKVRL